MSDAPVVGSGTLRAFAADVLVALSAERDTAVLVAESLVDADLRGIDSHGVHLLDLYCTRIGKGQIDPRGTPRVVDDRGSVVHLDGGLGFGQPCGRPGDRPRDRACPGARDRLGRRAGDHAPRCARLLHAPRRRGRLRRARVPERPHVRPAVRRDHAVVLDQPVLVCVPHCGGTAGGVRHRHHRRRRQQAVARQEAR